MLNSCPPRYSCGTIASIWTEDPLPIEVGVVTNATAYGVGEWWKAEGIEYCKVWRTNLQVMRCSNNNENDVIYKYVGQFRERCTLAFCGMM